MGTNAKIIYDIKDAAWLAANSSYVLDLNEPLYVNDGRYTFGDGITPISGLTFFPTALLGAYILRSGTVSGAPITGDQEILNSLASWRQFSDDGTNLIEIIMLPATDLIMRWSSGLAQNAVAANNAGSTLLSDDGAGNTSSIKAAGGSIFFDTTGFIRLGSPSSTTARTRWFNSTNNNYVGIQAGSTSAVYTLTLPTALGSGGFLKSDGSGNMSFDSTAYQPLLGYTPVSNALNSGNIFVGNASNNAAGVTLSLSGTGGSFGLSNSGILTMPDAGTSARGLLTAADWNTFNGKQNALGYTPENSANKATGFTTLNNTLYPTTQAVATYVTSQGYITSVTGTTNRITVTGGSTIDIASTYVGQSSITTLGTVTAGATGAGFTLNFGASTLSGSIPTTNTDAKIKGSIGATAGLIAFGTGTADTLQTSAKVKWVDASAMLVIAGTSGVNGFQFDTPGNAKARFNTISGISNWGAFSINSSYNGTGWVLDDTTLNGGFFKLDARSSAGANTIAFFRIPTGAGAHTNETAMFDMNLNTGLGKFYSGLQINSTSTAPQLTIVPNTSAALSADGDIAYNGTNFLARRASTNETLITGTIVTGTFLSPSSTTVLRVNVGGVTYNLQTIT